MNYLIWKDSVKSFKVYFLKAHLPSGLLISFFSVILVFVLHFEPALSTSGAWGASALSVPTAHKHLQMWISEYGLSLVLEGQFHSYSSLSSPSPATCVISLTRCQQLDRIHWGRAVDWLTRCKRFSYLWFTKSRGQ